MPTPFQPAEVAEVDGMPVWIESEDALRAMFEGVRFPAAPERAQDACVITDRVLPVTAS